MKKLIAMLLAMIMVCSLATVAFATSEDPVEPVDPPAGGAGGSSTPAYTDQATVTISKTYTVTNSDTSYPDETFTFTIDADGVANGGVGSDNQGVPTIGNVEFKTEHGTATKDVTITLPTYTAVGVYSYTIKEVAGDTAGVTYYDDEIKLVVTVIQGADNKIRVAAVHTEAAGEAKSNEIENVYNAGSLSVDKTVTGIMGDLEKYFAITITLTGVTGEDYTGNVITVGDTSYESNPESVTVGTPATFYLKNGETITLGNIPYGVTYSVTEEDLTDYTETITDNDNGLIDAATQTVNVVNDKGGDVDTGVALDSAPYIVMLVVAMVGVVALVSKKRYEV